VKLRLPAGPRATALPPARRRRAAPGFAAACAALVLGLAGAPALAQTKLDASRLYEDAVVRFDKGDFDGAIVQLKSALQIDRTRATTHLLLGRALLANSDVAGAEVALAEAQRQGASRAEVVLPLARALAGQGKPLAVLEDPRFAPDGLPPSVQAQVLLLRAAAHADLGDMRQALRALDDARALAPGSADVRLAEVPVRIRAQQFDEARAAAEQALKLSPGSAEGLYLRGSIAHAQGRVALALADYDAALRADPQHVEALLARIGLRLDQNQIDAAARDVQALRAMRPKEPRGAYFEALVAERQGRPQAARDALNEIVSLVDPVALDFMRYRPQLLILGGLAHYGLGNFAKARPYLEAVQRGMPGSPVAKVLADVYLAEKNVDAAIDVLERYLRTAPNDALALVQLAGAQMAQGRHAKATQVLQEALRRGDSPRLRTVLGLTLVGAGKTGDALAAFEAAVQRDPGQLGAGAALVSLHLARQRVAKAVAVAEGLARRHPANPGVQQLLGTALAAAGDTARARTAYEQAAKLDARFAEPRVELARLDAAAGQLDRAEQRLARALELQPRFVPALIERGLLTERRGERGEEATRWFEKAALLDTAADVRGGIALIDHHLRARRPADAVAAARELGTRAPENIDALMASARAHVLAADAVSARASLSRASRLADFDPGTQTRIALLQLAAGDAKAAAYSLSKALSADPAHVGAAALLADIELREGEAAKAEARARELVARHPNLAVGHALLGDVSRARGQAGPALEAYRRAHQVQPSTDTLLALHRQLASADAAAAATLAQGWLHTHPRDRAVWRALADGHARTGNLKAARAAYEALLALVPDEPEALNNLAQVMLRQSDPDARTIANRALTLRPDAAHILGTAGWASFQAGETERALRLLRDSVARDPSNAETRYYLGAVLAKAGRVGEARQELQAALADSARLPPSAREADALLRSLK
jgi:putative PEP-CTERM system TPR-repeat lipoprotein